MVLFFHCISLVRCEIILTAVNPGSISQWENRTKFFCHPTANHISMVIIRYLTCVSFLQYQIIPHYLALKQILALFRQCGKLIERQVINSPDRYLTPKGSRILVKI